MNIAPLRLRVSLRFIVDDREGSLWAKEGGTIEALSDVVLVTSEPTASRARSTLGTVSNTKQAGTNSTLRSIKPQ